MDFFDGQMSDRDRAANAGAKFYAAREPHAPLVTSTGTGQVTEDGSTDETYGPPCIEIAGVQVYTYVRDGILVVSLHYDTAELDSFATYGEDDAIPTIIKAGDGKTVWSAVPEDYVTYREAAQLRASGDFEPAWELPDWADPDY